ncbi:hypothetical protein CBR_g45622 [Chara braunii]|uniref:CHAT domain-containing protein n=1 Tax=Chara braunii TaxID=69332 RepID=A0A388LZ14_CHABU|nr:hypothetical protein CBR_g45622 [Chara braunii]|eukprot:GBG87564.1 hypothetical protein CBR_g45622 [Chara braunii]
MQVIREVRSLLSEGESGIPSQVYLVETSFRTWRRVTDRPHSVAYFLAELWRGMFYPKPWEERIVFPSVAAMEQILHPSSSFNELEAAFFCMFVERYRNGLKFSRDRMSALRKLLAATQEDGNHDIARQDAQYFLPFRAIALFELQFISGDAGHNLADDDVDLLELHGQAEMPLHTAHKIWHRLWSAWLPDGLTLPLQGQTGQYAAEVITGEFNPSTLLCSNSLLPLGSEAMLCKSMEMTCAHHVLTYSDAEKDDTDDVLSAINAAKQRIAEAKSLGLVEEAYLGCQDLANMAIFDAATGDWTTEKCMSLLARVVAFCMSRRYKKWSLDVFDLMGTLQDLKTPTCKNGDHIIRYKLIHLRLAREVAMADQACLEAQMRELRVVCELSSCLFTLKQVDLSRMHWKDAIRLHSCILDRFGNPLAYYPLEVIGPLWAKCKEGIALLCTHHGNYNASVGLYREVGEVYKELEMLSPSTEAWWLIQRAHLSLWVGKEGLIVVGTEDPAELLDKAEKRLEVMKTQDTSETCNQIRTHIQCLRTWMLVEKEESRKAVENVEALAATFSRYRVFQLSSCLHNTVGNYQQAEKARVEGLALFKSTQRSIGVGGSLPEAWLSIYGGEEEDEFRDAQIDCHNRDDASGALVWSEWSHHRLASSVLMSRKQMARGSENNNDMVTSTRQSSAGGDDDGRESEILFEQFDSDMEAALLMIQRGCELCGPGTTMIEYHFSPGTDSRDEILMIYVLTVRNWHLRSIARLYKPSTGVEVHVKKLMEVMNADPLETEPTTGVCSNLDLAHDLRGNNKSDTSMNNHAGLPGLGCANSKKSPVASSSSISRTPPALPPTARGPHVSSKMKHGLLGKQSQDSQHRRTTKAILEKLYKLLIAPVEHVLEDVTQDDKLVFVPHGILWNVPFAILRDGKRRGSSNKPYLIERHTIGIVPAAHLLPVLQEGSAHLLKKMCREDVDENHGMGVQGRSWKSVVLGDPFPPAYGMDPLPGAREEAREIYSFLAPGTATLLIGTDATKPQVVPRLERGAPIAHFATHVLVGSRAEIKRDIDTADMGLLVLADLCSPSDAPPPDPSSPPRSSRPSNPFLSSISGTRCDSSEGPLPRTRQHTTKVTAGLNDLHLSGSTLTHVNQVIAAEPYTDAANARDKIPTSLHTLLPDPVCGTSDVPPAVDKLQTIGDRNGLQDSGRWNGAGDTTYDSGESSAEGLFLEFVKDCYFENEEGRYDLGGLSAEEMLKLFNYDVNTLLVVLSGCNSSLGRLTPEGVLSYTRSFYMSRVPCVVSSLWPVFDDATRPLMLAFYGALRDGNDVSSALRIAILSMMYARRPSQSSVAVVPDHGTLSPSDSILCQSSKSAGEVHNSQERDAEQQCNTKHHTNGPRGVPFPQDNDPPLANQIQSSTQEPEDSGCCSIRYHQYRDRTSLQPLPGVIVVEGIWEEEEEEEEEEEKEEEEEVEGICEEEEEEEEEASADGGGVVNPFHKGEDSEGGPEDCMPGCRQDETSTKRGGNLSCLCVNEKDEENSTPPDFSDLDIASEASDHYLPSESQDGSGDEREGNDSGGDDETEDNDDDEDEASLLWEPQHWGAFMSVGLPTLKLPRWLFVNSN